LIPELLDADGSDCSFGEIQCVNDPNTENEEKINCPVVDPDCFDEQAQRECILMELECQNMEFQGQNSTDGCKVEFICLDDDEPVEEPESRSLNQPVCVED
jgi:hypothetical protein